VCEHTRAITSDFAFQLLKSPISDAAWKGIIQPNNLLEKNSNLDIQSGADTLTCMEQNRKDKTDVMGT